MIGIGALVFTTDGVTLTTDKIGDGIAGIRLIIGTILTIGVIHIIGDIRTMLTETLPEVPITEHQEEQFTAHRLGPCSKPERLIQAEIFAHHEVF